MKNDLPETCNKTAGRRGPCKLPLGHEGFHDDEFYLKPCPKCFTDLPQLSRNEQHKLIIFCRKCGFEIDGIEQDALVDSWQSQICVT